MPSSLLICMLLFIGSTLIFSWKHIFVVFLFMDFLGLMIVLGAGSFGTCSFILLLVLQVYSSAFGVSLLVWVLRSFGSDKVRAFF